MNDPENSIDLSDEQLERVFEQLAGYDPAQSVDEDVARARGAIEMIQRVRNAERAETVRRVDTMAEPHGFAFGKIEMPSQLGRFEIRKQIGQGGFGLVFLANDPNLGREVALKIPRPQAMTTTESQRRFLREGRAAASLAHPNIVPVFESGQIGSVYFIASQFIPGETLAEFANSHPAQVTPKTVSAIVGRLAEAMGHAHQRGILHRDLKPSNVLVETAANSDSKLEDRVRIADFGLAKIESDQSETETGAIVGTPLFMSPEQTVANATVGPQSDIYSLGAILYHLLAGKPPFQEATRHDTITAVRNEEPKPIRLVNGAVPKDLEAICLKCLEKRPEKRYATAFELAEDLSRFENNEPVLARRITMLDRAVRWVIRNPLAAALFSVVLLSTIVVSTLLVNSELLRTESNNNQQKVIQKTRQLQSAIDHLFLSIAATPELKLAGLDSLRRKMYFEASQLYQNLVSDVPDDTDLFLAYVETKLSFAKLTGSLGEQARAQEVIAGLLHELDGQLAKQDLLAESRRELVHAQVETLRLNLSSVATNEGSNAIQDQILVIIDSDEFQPDNFPIPRASAMSDVASYATQTRDQVLAKKIIAQALKYWDEVPEEDLNDPIVLQELIGCYSNALLVASEQEDSASGIPLAEKAIQIFDLENVDVNEFQPETLSQFSSMLTHYAFLLRNTDIEKGINFAAEALEIITPIANSHPSMADFQSRRCEVGFKYALLHHIKTDYEKSGELFHSELEQSERLQKQFPEYAKFESHTANCLWMLGLWYKKYFDFENQLIMQKKSRAIIAKNPERTPRIRMDLAGLDGEIGFSMAKLGDVEEGLETIVAGCRELETIVAEDPANGQAKRFLQGNLEFASETARRLERYDDAKTYFDRMIEIQGGPPTPKQLSARIEIAVGRKKYQELESLLDDYSSSFETLGNADLFHDAKMFCFALEQLQKVNDGSDSMIQIEILEARVVDATIKGLERWLRTSENQQESLDRIQAEAELETLREYEAFDAMVAAFSN